MTRIFLLQNREKRVDEPVERGRVDAFGIPDGILDQGEMGAVNQGHTVEKEETIHAARVLSPARGVQRM